MRWGPMMVLVALCTPGLGAQEAPPMSRRLSFTTSAGVMLRGPASGVASRMSGLGYGQDDPGGCSPFLFWEICSEPTSYPRLHRGRAASFTVRYESSPRWATSVGVATNQFGSAIGNSGNTLLDVSWTGTSGWVAAHYKPREWLSLGAGPAVHSFKGGVRESVMRLGLMTELGVRIPARSRVFVATTLRAHLVPGSRVVPHQFGFWSSEMGGQTVPLLVKWGHQTFDVGLGLRL
jgi:hypothetical protein